MQGILVGARDLTDLAVTYNSFVQELNDALLCLALATTTRGVAGCNDAVDKVMLAYDHAAGRRKGAMM